MDPSNAEPKTVHRVAVQARLRRLDEQLTATRRAEQAMPLTTYYGPQPLRPIPLAEFLEDGPWAA
jgi:hypothetical protein